MCLHLSCSFLLFFVTIILNCLASKLPRGWVKLIHMLVFFFFMTQQPLVGQALLIIEFSRSHSDYTKRGRTPLDEWSVRRTYIYLTTHNTHSRQTSMPTVGLEPEIPASEEPQAHRPRPRVHRDRRKISYSNQFSPEGQNTQNCHAYRPPHYSTSRCRGIYVTCTWECVDTHTHTHANSTRIFKFSHVCHV